MRWWLGLLAALASWQAPAQAGSLADVFRSPAFAHLGLAPLGTALATTVASAYPIASASSSVVYEYNVDLDILERRPGPAGPLFGERAETIGRGRLNLGVGYSYIHLTTIDGKDLSSLPSRRTAAGQILYVSVPGGVTLRDGRHSSFLPVQVDADIDVTAHQMAVSATYGVTAKLDVNVTVPLLETSLDLTAKGLAPDPRFPRFALPHGRTTTFEPSESADATGVGDVLLRSKYRAYEGPLVDAAVGLGIALPTGREEDFQGTGDVHVQPTLVLSHVVAARTEPFMNLGVDCNAGDVDRSVVRWAVGAAVEATGTITAVATFLGRNELGAQADPIPAPFFFQVHRNDVYDASIGLRWRFAERGIVSANVMVPLNDDGLRVDALPGLDVEYAF